MATTRGANVIRITSTDTIPSSVNIVAIKSITNSGGSVLIRDLNNGVSGNIIYEAAGTLDVFDEVKIRATGGIVVTIAAPTVCYIYTA